MPNWSYNNLSISGTPEKMKEFYDVAFDDKEIFAFSNIFPMPEKIKNTISPSSSALGKKWMNEDILTKRNDALNEILELDENDPQLIPCENNSPEKCKLLKQEFGADNWYDWNIFTYGTKWDVSVSSDEYFKDDESFDCSFDTAWSPPSAFLHKLQSKFKDLDIRLTFELEGSDTCGVFYTDRYQDEVNICYEEDEVTFVGSDGRKIYQDENGDWRYHADDEICEDYEMVNPFR